MVCFKNKNPSLGKFWRALKWKLFWPFEILYGHLGYLMTAWYLLCSFGAFLSGLGIMYRTYQEKSGNPGINSVSEPCHRQLMYTMYQTLWPIAILQ
jgi:hypothetical protein